MVSDITIYRPTPTVQTLSLWMELSLWVRHLCSAMSSGSQTVGSGVA